MEKVINNEMTKLLILLGAGVIGLAVVLVRMITKVRGSFKPYQRPTMLYLFLSLLFFAVIALAVHPAIFEKRLTAFIFLQAYFMMLGTVNCCLRCWWPCWAASVLFYCMVIPIKTIFST
jgi:uncharacterized membrane protein YcgQ (UPF0703/DUF1980 family)